MGRGMQEMNRSFELRYFFQSLLHYYASAPFSSCYNISGSISICMNDMECTLVSFVDIIAFVSASVFPLAFPWGWIKINPEFPLGAETTFICLCHRPLSQSPWRVTQDIVMATVDSLQVTTLNYR